MKHIKNFSLNESTQTEVKWVKDSDRHILIQRDANGEVVGLNYMQGEEDPDFDGVDAKLSQFYVENHEMIKGEDELDTIDNAIWLFFHATNAH